MTKQELSFFLLHILPSFFYYSFEAGGARSERLVRV